MALFLAVAPLEARRGGVPVDEAERENIVEVRHETPLHVVEIAVVHGDALDLAALFHRLVGGLGVVVLPLGLLLLGGSGLLDPRRGLVLGEGGALQLLHAVQFLRGEGLALGLESDGDGLYASLLQLALGQHEAVDVRRPDGERLLMPAGASLAEALQREDRSAVRRPVAQLARLRQEHADSSEEGGRDASVSREDALFAEQVENVVLAEP
mmetsp:Transcript_11768/g.23760  ORF Transcript_11768/g.23760 Transcript_11768/m.23760 type:complete len:211 (-) Transcript_11768:617-1249(-)